MRSALLSSDASRAFLPQLLPAVVVALLGYLAMVSHDRVVIVDETVAAVPETADPYPRSPLLRISGNELIYQGRMIATVDSVVRDDSPTFKIDVLAEALEVTADEVLDVLPGDRLRRHRDQVCAKNRENHQELHILCPGRTLVVELDDYADNRLLMKIINTTSAVGFHAAFATPRLSPRYSSQAR